MKSPLPEIARPATFLIAGLITLTVACGEAVDEDAAPRPDDSVKVSNYQRDLPITGVNEETDADDCNAEIARQYIGEPASFETKAEILEAVAPLVNVKWMMPDDSVDDDFNPERLLVQLDASELITGARCG